MATEDTREGPPPGRRTYVRPELTKIALQADEAVLGSCKTDTSGGVGNAPGAGACGLCSTVGS